MNYLYLEVQIFFLSHTHYKRKMENLKKHKKSKSEQKQVFFISIVFFICLLLHILPLTYKIIINLSEIFYFLMSMVILAFIIKNNRKKLTTFFLCVIPAIFGIYILQVISVNNNSIFGSFGYGSTFKHQIAGVPIIISLFWVVLIISALSLASKITRNAILRILYASLLLVILDFLMEPVAMKLDYWQWEGKTVPLQNYATWFIISFLITSVFAIVRMEPRSLVSRTFFLILIAFFALLNIFL